MHHIIIIMMFSVYYFSFKRNMKHISHLYRGHRCLLHGYILECPLLAFDWLLDRHNLGYFGEHHYRFPPDAVQFVLSYKQKWYRVNKYNSQSVIFF